MGVIPERPGGMIGGNVVFVFMREFPRGIEHAQHVVAVSGGIYPAAVKVVVGDVEATGMGVGIVHARRPVRVMVAFLRRNQLAVKFPGHAVGGKPGLAVGGKLVPGHHAVVKVDAHGLARLGLDQGDGQVGIGGRLAPRAAAVLAFQVDIAAQPDGIHRAPDGVADLDLLQPQLQPRARIAFTRDGARGAARRLEDKPRGRAAVAIHYQGWRIGYPLPLRPRRP